MIKTLKQLVDEYTLLREIKRIYIEDKYDYIPHNSDRYLNLLDNTLLGLHALIAYQTELKYSITKKDNWIVMVGKEDKDE